MKKEERATLERALVFIAVIRAESIDQGKLEFAKQLDLVIDQIEQMLESGFASKSKTEIAVDILAKGSFIAILRKYIWGEKDNDDDDFWGCSD